MVIFSFLIFFAPQAKAVTIQFKPDTVSVTGETNIYINVPGNGELSVEGDVWQNSLVIDYHVMPF